MRSESQVVSCALKASQQELKFMLILILVDVQYLQKVVFIFGKGSNSQNHSSLDSHHQIKKSPCKISRFPTLEGLSFLTFNTTGKALLFTLFRAYSRKQELAFGITKKGQESPVKAGPNTGYFSRQ